VLVVEGRPEPPSGDPVAAAREATELVESVPQAPGGGRGSGSAAWRLIRPGHFTINVPCMFVWMSHWK
jgi:hypothetical protein